MDRSDTNELAKSVLAQSVFRLRFGLLVAFVISCIYFFGPYESVTSTVLVTGLLVLYVVYTALALYFSKRPSPLSHWDIALITAVIDPLMLSAWMLIAGESSILFVGFYLFTILGFGFRVGAVPMHVCQALSLVGFSAVVLISDSWRGQLLFSLSHVILLIVVPLYASVLIGKLQKAKDMAQHESRAKSQLLAKVSHELRTPLTGIVSSAQLLEIESRESTTIARAGSILHLASSLDVEIRQLLDLSRIESRKEKAEAHSFSLAFAATHVVRAMKPIAEGKSLQVGLEFDERIRLPVMGQHQDLISVLTNLAGNAVKFTSEGAVTLRVRLLEQTEGAYRIWFAMVDTGIGIAPEFHDKIFQPFFQVESGSNRSHSGTGLGTTIANELVRQMGGVLKVDSAPGRGSVFSFELLMPIDASAAEQEEPAPPAGDALITGKRILVADDNATNLELMREMLLKDGHLVTAVDSGHAAILKLSSGNFDVIFLDFNMSDVDGAAVYQTYTYSRIHVAPTFFVTADATAMTTRMLEDLGANGVIYKPITFEKIRGVLNELFPGEGVATSGRDDLRPRRKAAELSSVPVEYIDAAAIDNLREIKDSPEFLYKVISDGMADIEALETQLLVTIGGVDLPLLHRQAHAMKGVSLSVGAVRLCSLSDRFMTMTNDMLAADPARWQEELSRTTRQSLEALEEVRSVFLSQKAVNN